MIPIVVALAQGKLVKIVMIGTGASTVPRACIGFAPVAVCVGMIGLEPDHDAEVGDRPGIVPRMITDQSPTIMGGGILGSEADDLGEVGQGAIVQAEIVEDPTAGQIKARVVRTKPDRLFQVNNRVVPSLLLHSKSAAAHAHQPAPQPAKRDNPANRQSQQSED